MTPEDEKLCSELHAVSNVILILDESGAATAELIKQGADRIKTLSAEVERHKAKHHMACAAQEATWQANVRLAKIIRHDPDHGLEGNQEAALLIENDTLKAERDALAGEVARLRDALRHYAYADYLTTDQQKIAYELICNTRESSPSKSRNASAANTDGPSRSTSEAALAQAGLACSQCDDCDPSFLDCWGTGKGCRKPPAAQNGGATA